MNYKASLSRRQKISTAIVLALFVAFNQWRIISTVLGERDLNHYFLIAIFIDIILLYGFLISPRYYFISEKEIIISRIILKRHITFKDIERVEQISSEDMSRSFFTFGINGFFGSFGKFANSRHGNMTWYVTQRINFIMLHLKSGERIVLTPDDAGMFEKLQSAIK